MSPRVLLVVGLAASSLGCNGPAEQKPPPDVVAAQASAHPVDHLAPNELLEGTDTAFGLVLPRSARVDRAFPDIVYASAIAPFDAMVDYVRVRVREGSFTKSTFVATFSHVRVPARPGHELQILLRDVPGYHCEIELRDTTPVAPPVYADEQSTWRGQGLRPGGALLDPTHLE